MSIERLALVSNRRISVDVNVRLDGWAGSDLRRSRTRISQEEVEIQKLSSNSEVNFNCQKICTTLVGTVFK